MLKEKILFWPLFAVFVGILIFGFLSQEKKKLTAEELLQDIEKATKKSIAKKKSAKEKWDFEKISAEDILGEYESLLKRSPFFRVASNVEVKKVELKPIKEEPKKPMFKYKGRAMMGTKVMVVIEDRGTGKSFFVEEGNMVGDFLVSSIDEKRVVLKKSGGEEIVLNASKKEKKEEPKEEAE